MFDPATVTSSSSIGKKQWLFTYLLPRLIDYIFAQGYTASVREVQRASGRAAELAAAYKGIANSLHIHSLAVDIAIFQDGDYLTSSDQYEFAGTYWKSLHPLCCWGGDFTSTPDGNHFSITHDGRR